MRSTIFHLIGPPGVGKYTVGTEVARLTGARLIDNHSVANVIFNVIGADGVTPLPAGIWPYVGRVRKAVLDSVTELAPPEASFVFTNFIRGEDAGEYAAFMEVAAVADARGSVFVPVILSCDTPEVTRRIVGADRAARMKLVDPVAGARYNDGPAFRTIIRTRCCWMSRALHRRPPPATSWSGRVLYRERLRLAKATGRRAGP